MDHETDGMACFRDEHEQTPELIALRDDTRRWITSGFSRRDRLIIILYYYESLTMKETGRTLGISESRVSQRLESIIQCLRARLARIDAEAEFIQK
jgi:RNA polymerase sigma factor for flagellar operon FliA